MNLPITTTPHEWHKLLLAFVALSKKSFVALGKVLYELKKEDSFKQAIGVMEWEDYLRQPEIGLSKGEAGRLIQIYENFVLKFGYDEDTIAKIPVKNMHYLLPIAKKLTARDEIDEYVADATFLSQKDFKEKIYEKKMDGVLTRTYEYMIMRKTMETSTLDRVPNIDSETIKQTFNLE